MKAEESKTAATALHELSESSIDLLNAMKETTGELKAIKKLWREGNKSRLIKLGMTIFFFPEPTPVCEIIGAGIMAAGAIQKGIQSRTIYVEDINKTFQKTLKEVLTTKHNLRI